MREIKLLKDLENSTGVCEQNAKNMYGSHIELIKCFQEWMTLQHNCAIRGVSPYFTELLMEMSQMKSETDLKSFAAFDAIVKGLMKDESDVQEAKNSLSQLQSQMNWTPANTEEVENELNAKAIELNSKFISKEVKKIIRFKFGLEHIINQQLEHAENYIRLLKAQKKLIALVPEAYDSETFKKNKISVSNTAREIVQKYQEQSAGADSGQPETSTKKSSAQSKLPVPLSQVGGPESPSSESATSDDSLTQQTPRSKHHHECSCLGYLCENQHNATSSDMLSCPSFLLNSPDASEGSKYFLSEIAKNCSLIARKLSETSISAPNNTDHQTPGADGPSELLRSLSPSFPDGAANDTTLSGS